MVGLAFNLPAITTESSAREEVVILNGGWVHSKPPHSTSVPPPHPPTFRLNELFVVAHQSPPDRQCISWKVKVSIHFPPPPPKTHSRGTSGPIHRPPPHLLLLPLAPSPHNRLLLFQHWHRHRSAFAHRFIILLSDSIHPPAAAVARLPARPSLLGETRLPMLTMTIMMIITECNDFLGSAS